MKLALLQCDAGCGNFSTNADKLVVSCAATDADICAAPLAALCGPMKKQVGLESKSDWLAELAPAMKKIAQALRAGQHLILGDSSVAIVLLCKDNLKVVEAPFKIGNLVIAPAFEPWLNTGADILVNLDPRPFFPKSQTEWELILSGLARSAGCVCVSCNIVGGYGQRVYNGQSVCADAYGNIIARANGYKEDCLELDIRAGGRMEPLMTLYEEQWLALVTGVRDFVRKAGAQKVLLGLSGGMDSALVACIARDALGADNVLGVLMPSPYTSPESVRDAEELGRNLNIKTCSIPITPVFNSFRQSLAPVFSTLDDGEGVLTEENLQARIRGVILMAISNQTGALVLNTGNLSEAMMGYCTLYGDTVGAVAVIGDLFKTRVYELGRWYCRHMGQMVIPKNTFDRPPSAELAPNQKDTDTLPPYEELDPVLEGILCGKSDGADDELLKTINRNSFKRRLCPPPLLVGNARLINLGESNAI